MLGPTGNRVGIVLAMVVALGDNSSRIVLADSVEAISARQSAGTCQPTATRDAAVRRAADVCGTASISFALGTVLGVPQAKAEAVSEQMAAQDIHQVLDLRLLAGEEAEELVDTELKLDGVSIGVRSKVRLLMSASEAGGGSHPNHPPGGMGLSNQSTTATTARSAQRQRRLQGDEGDGGASFDTIAIVLSVLVGAAGYVVQAYTARRAERVAEEQAQELQISETRRQREHEQMLAQIHRTERVVDECCGPGMLALAAYFWSCVSFTAEGVSVLEKTNPEIISMLLSHVAAHFETKDDGTVLSNLSGKILWERKPGFVVASSSGSMCAPTGAAVQIVSAMYILPTLTQPYAAVTGQPILGVIEADPSSDLAIRYRHFMQCSVIPGMRKVAAIFEAHSAIIELPDKKWLEEKFPNEPWQMTREDHHIYSWLAAVLGWERLAKHWDTGDYRLLQPQNHAALPPLGGLLSILNWSQERGRAKQEELIGMTKADDQTISENWERLSQVVAKPS